MRRMIEKILNCYGTAATVCHNGEEGTVRCFFQPSTSKSWQAMDPMVTPLGQIPGGQYLYIGPAGQAVAAGDTMTVADCRYLVRRAEAYRDRNEIVYWWALCAKKGGDDTWGCRE